MSFPDGDLIVYGNSTETSTGFSTGSTRFNEKEFAQIKEDIRNLSLKAEIQPLSLSTSWIPQIKVKAVTVYVTYVQDLCTNALQLSIRYNEQVNYAFSEGISVDDEDIKDSINTIYSFLRKTGEQLDKLRTTTRDYDEILSILSTNIRDDMFHLCPRNLSEFCRMSKQDVPYKKLVFLFNRYTDSITQEVDVTLVPIRDPNRTYGIELMIQKTDSLARLSLMLDQVAKYYRIDHLTERMKVAMAEHTTSMSRLLQEWIIPEHDKLVTRANSITDPDEWNDLCEKRETILENWRPFCEREVGIDFVEFAGRVNIVNTSFTNASEERVKRFLKRIASRMQSTYVYRKGDTAFVNSEIAIIQKDIQRVGNDEKYITRIRANYEVVSLHFKAISSIIAIYNVKDSGLDVEGFDVITKSLGHS